MAGRRERRAAWRASRRIVVSFETQRERGFDLFAPESEVIADDRKRRGVTRLQDTVEWRARWAP